MPGISPAALEALTAEILTRAGADQGEAQTVSGVMTWADQRGLHVQGCVWLETLVARVRSGSLVSPAQRRLENRSRTTAVLDAGGGFGHVAAKEAVATASAMAADHGMGLVAVHSSHHFGPAGFYAELIARDDLIGLVATNAAPKVAPPGGIEPGLGTNPLGFAVPVDDADPIVGDLATGALAGSRVRDAIAADEQLEPGLAIDHRGVPTTDPRAIGSGGAMLPAAGAKGFALGLLVELLTSGLSGGLVGRNVGSVFDLTRPSGVSHAVLAVSPLDDGFGARARDLAEQLIGAGGSVRIPGWNRAAMARAATSGGIELPAESRRSLTECARSVGLAPPRDF